MSPILWSAAVSKSGAANYRTMTSLPDIADQFLSARTTKFVRAVKRSVYSFLYPLYQKSVGWHFDRKWGTETTQIVEHQKDNGDPLRLTAVQYEPTSPKLFHKMMHSLNCMPEELSFFDVGCGKGRCLLMATTYSFRRIVGIEFAPELVAVAENNVTRFQARHPSEIKIEIVSMDAAQYNFPDEDAVIFFFNPFTEEIMVKVLDNIRRSSRTTKQRYIVYNNAVLAHLLGNPKEFSLVVDARSFSIFKMIL
ncbi:class I SAM-dependent methyltransferase [Noviherbaspirillum saxi]|uniref:Class I SAM-dependent methyltransferase n=1 Tax=Noviherbaspirillum saxi TaxID=2320863 RepID=A0A3A3FKQ5_9BURK|nr:class I SAM-dependent methyltransferase [Noviherbaspirillum saxi]RJF95887.1 class I SAM-dependent methyltransferase [Noviherbaspirillum saxi]